MQRRTTAALSLVLLASVALTGCTSGGNGDEDEETTTSDSAPTTEGAIPKDPEWFCRLIAKEAVDAATDGRSAEAREVEALNTENEYQCDVVLPTEDGGTEVAMSLSMHRNIPNLADERLAEVKAIDGVAPGPDYLGVSYIADTMAVSVVPCKPDANVGDEVPPVPYVFVLRAQLDTEGKATPMLHSPLNRLVQEMDAAYGCSPSMITENEGWLKGEGDTGQQTQAPSDAAAGT